ncbi:MAG: DUF2683 family protein [Flavisolibacter sp.]
MTFIAHPTNPKQEKAVKAFLEALQVPYEVEPNKDETEHLLSTEANKNTCKKQWMMSSKEKAPASHSMMYGNNLLT